MSILENPIDMFSQWYEEAKAQELNNPNAMALATSDQHGAPSVRMVLMQYIDAGQLVFFTNLNSPKAQELTANSRVSACFYWKSLGRQVRFWGHVIRASDEETDRYFASRPTGSQLGAWASHQSQPLENREILESRIAEYALMYGDDDIPRPPHWGGFRIIPEKIEFWIDHPFRLHDRFLYTYNSLDEWEVKRLYP